MIFGQRFQITWDQSVTNFKEDIGWYMLSLAVGAGAIIVSWIIVNLGDACLNCNRKKPRFSLNVKKSYARLLIVLVAIAVLAGGFWLACGFAGVSFYNIILSFGIITLIATYAFGPDIQAAGGYVTLCSVPKFEEGQWIEIIGTSIQGIVEDIGISHVTMRGADGQPIFVPTHYFKSNAIRRDEKKETRGITNKIFHY